MGAPGATKRWTPIGSENPFQLTAPDPVSGTIVSDRADD
jgi:hypothetical protein